MTQEYTEGNLTQLQTNLNANTDILNAYINSNQAKINIASTTLKQGPLLLSLCIITNYRKYERRQQS